MLHRVQEGGSRSGGRVVLVHGFTQTARSWDAVARHLVGRGHEVVRVELPGHGSSASVRLPFEAAALALGDAGGRGSYVGYSMGGRLCLRLAVQRPDLVTSLVLVSASPGLVDEGDRAARRRADARLAEEVEREGTHRFLDRWLAQPLLASTTPPDAELAARRANPPDGLAYALRQLGTGAQEPLWGYLNDFDMPVLLVVGEHDAKFRAIADRMAVGMGGRARVEMVEGAGHAVPLDRPDACARLVDEFVGAVTR